MPANFVIKFVDHFVEIEALVEPLSPKFLLGADLEDVMLSFLFPLRRTPTFFYLTLHIFMTCPDL